MFGSVPADRHPTLGTATLAAAPRVPYHLASDAIWARRLAPHAWARRLLCFWADEETRPCAKGTITKTSTEKRWVLEGRLTQPWMAELERQWRKTHGTCQGDTCLVDLNDGICRKFLL
jgi:hypothetical protein